MANFFFFIIIRILCDPSVQLFSLKGVIISPYNPSHTLLVLATNTTFYFLGIARDTDFTNLSVNLGLDGGRENEGEENACEWENGLWGGKDIFC